MTTPISNTTMSAAANSTIPLSGEPKLNAIMTEIEKKTEHKLAELMHPVANKSTIDKLDFITEQSKSPGAHFGDKLVSIMSQGAKEFEEKTGRRMTYSEMRSMYG
uniref:Uncharacterized protein n=1 Tax=viral metagenome TaxID=1070528 RepID=A0A6C0HHN7_9ZZZZ